MSVIVGEQGRISHLQKLKQFFRIANVWYNYWKVNMYRWHSNLIIEIMKVLSALFQQSQPLLKLGNNDEDEENLLKRQYLLYRLCDLETVETKVKEHAYRTLEEFREDAATIKHNANIWFGGSFV